MTTEKLLHSDAMAKAATLTAKGITDGFNAVAKMANEFGAESSSTTISWVSEDEEVDAAYVPELILRVCKA